MGLILTTKIENENISQKIIAVDFEKRLNVKDSKSLDWSPFAMSLSFGYKE